MLKKKKVYNINEKKKERKANSTKEKHKNKLKKHFWFFAGGKKFSSPIKFETP